ncbi:glycosyltransferase family 2 protein [Candidatus Gottesmanbacteria bacterium]|nr:glycosyltransferase family 2 protein [Candidatus Gottesmanbacteria bacterium]
MKNDIDLSIIIVNFNTRDLLIRCLTSVASAQTDGDRWELIVVDNASTDGSVEKIQNSKFKIQNLMIIQNTENLGFAKANNIGIKKSHGKYILLLNSDTEVEKGTIQAMLGFMEAHPEAGAATCKLLLPDGSLDPACHRGFPTPWAALTYFVGLERLFPRSRLFAGYHMGYKDLSQVHEVDAISGAFFLTTRAVIDRVGMLDEDYFMYGEDLDWAFRIKEAGLSILFNPDVSVLHRKKQSGRQHQDPAIRRATDQHFYETMQLFYQKHYAKRYGRLVTQMILLGIKLKSLL